MSTELLLDRLFAGGELTLEESHELQSALAWRPWWPDVALVSALLRSNRANKSELPHLQPALELLQPIFINWKAHAEKNS